MRKEPKNQSGYSSTCRQCFNARDAELRRARLAASVVARCDKGIHKRTEKGTHFVPIADRYIHLPVAHMLDEFGFVLPEFKGTYEGKIRLPDAERLVREAEYRRSLADAAAQRDAVRRAKAEEREIEKAKARLAKAQWTADRELDFPRDVEVALYMRVKYRVRSYRRKHGFAVHKTFLGLFGRTIDEYFTENFGYSISDLRLHISKQFLPGMEWWKFLAGEIHLDHKSPMAMFDISDPAQLKNCYQLCNLQPMWADDNVKKGSWCDITDTWVTVRKRVNKYK